LLQCLDEVCRKQKAMLNPTKLIVVDEADRLQMASLEQLRAIFDESELGLS
jgi:DNA transposition AAA+ family ATPase